MSVIHVKQQAGWIQHVLPQNHHQAEGHSEYVHMMQRHIQKAEIPPKLSASY